MIGNSLLNFIAANTLYFPITLPIVLTVLSSVIEGTFKDFAKTSAKLCFAGISFDVWGLVTVAQGNANLGAIYSSRGALTRPPIIEAIDLILIMIIFIFFHMLFHAACLRLPVAQGLNTSLFWVLLRFFFLSLSVLVPVSLLAHPAMVF